MAAARRVDCVQAGASLRIAEFCEVARRDFIYTKGLTKGKEGTSTWICASPWAKRSLDAIQGTLNEYVSKRPVLHFLLALSMS